MAEFSVQEQLMLELVNRARLDPNGEATRFHISLNDHLPAGTLTGAAKPVLAPNELLVDSARAHSQFMLDHDKFAHEGIGDGTPQTRMTTAGYVFTLPFALGENIAIQGTTGAIDLTAMTLANAEGLFKSAGHRENILSTDFRELGIGIEQGSFIFSGDPTVYNSVDATQNFARVGSDFFITGVCITDADHDNFYDIGEQRAGITIEVRQGGLLVNNDTSATAGGYAVEVSGASSDVTFLGGDLVGAVNCTVNTGAGNVKVDLAGSAEILCSGSVTLGSGALDATLLGVGALNATGNAEVNALVGNKGANSLSGLDGNDSLSGVGGADHLQGGIGNDRLTGGGGRDFLSGGADHDIFDFNFLTDSGKTATTRDVITDFKHLIDDIDLSTIDAVTGGADNAFKFIGKSAFSHVAGQLHYSLMNWPARSTTRPSSRATSTAMRWRISRSN